ncbi:MAG: DUF6502 family protein [Paracoccaceae bacterium]
MASRDPFSRSTFFEKALTGILRPLVRALIAQGLTAPAFYRIVKQTYVEVAAEDLGQSATDSRVSVMTGVHRRDVKDFRNPEDSAEKAARQKISMLAMVIGRWMSHEQFCDDDGKPLDLPRTSETGPSFERLVASISRDVRPRTILDELLRQQIIALDGDVVRLLVEGLVGSDDMEQKLHFFSRNIGDHMNAAVENLLSETPPHFERAVYYTHLTEASVDDIETEARQVGAEALRSINAMAATHQGTDHTKAEAQHRFRFGVFFYKEDESAEGKGQISDEDR